MREMRLHKRELRDPEIIKEILEECDVVRIGTQDEEGMFIIPVNYGYDFSVSGDKMKLVLFIHGAGEGRKADAFADSPVVAVEMDCRHGLITGDYTCSYSYSYRSIMGTGMVRRVEDEQEKIFGLAKIMEHMAPGAEIEFRPEMLSRTEVFCIEVEHFTGKERRNTNGTSYRNVEI